MPNNQEKLRELAEEIHVEGQNRCAICFWPLAESADKGCVRGNCSQRGESGEYERNTHRARVEAILAVLKSSPLLAQQPVPEGHLSNPSPIMLQTNVATGFEPPWDLANWIATHDIKAKLITTKRENEDDEETVAFIFGPTVEAQEQTAKFIVEAVNRAASPAEALPMLSEAEIKARAGKGPDEAEKPGDGEQVIYFPSRKAASDACVVLLGKMIPHRYSALPQQGRLSEEQVARLFATKHGFVADGQCACGEELGDEEQYILHLAAAFGSVEGQGEPRDLKGKLFNLITRHSDREFLFSKRMKIAEAMLKTYEEVTASLRPPAAKVEADERGTK